LSWMAGRTCADAACNFNAKGHACSPMFSCLSCYSPPEPSSLQFLGHLYLCLQCATNHRWPTLSHSHPHPRKWTAHSPEGCTVRPARRSFHQNSAAVPCRLNAHWWRRKLATCLLYASAVLLHACLHAFVQLRQAASFRDVVVSITHAGALHQHSCQGSNGNSPVSRCRAVLLHLAGWVDSWSGTVTLSPCTAWMTAAAATMRRRTHRLIAMVRADTRVDGAVEAHGRHRWCTTATGYGRAPTLSRPVPCLPWSRLVAPNRLDRGSSVQTQRGTRVGREQSL